MWAAHSLGRSGALTATLSQLCTFLHRKAPTLSWVYAQIIRVKTNSTRYLSTYVASPLIYTHFWQVCLGFNLSAWEFKQLRTLLCCRWLWLFKEISSNYSNQLAHKYTFFLPVVNDGISNLYSCSFGSKVDAIKFYKIDVCNYIWFCWINNKWN